jgi:hypothetical protein
LRRAAATAGRTAPHCTPPAATPGGSGGSEGSGGSGLRERVGGRGCTRIRVRHCTTNPCALCSAAVQPALQAARPTQWPAARIHLHTAAPFPARCSLLPVCSAQRGPHASALLHRRLHRPPAASQARQNEPPTRAPLSPRLAPSLAPAHPR